MKQSFQEAWRDYRPLLCFGLLYVVLCLAQIFWVGISAGGVLGWIWTAVRRTVGLSCTFLALVALGGGQGIRGGCARLSGGPHVRGRLYRLPCLFYIALLHHAKGDDTLREPLRVG